LAVVASWPWPVTSSSLRIGRTFGPTEARCGLIPGARRGLQAGPAGALPVIIGHLITGRRSDAARAYELGLVNEVVSAAELDASVTSWVEDFLPSAGATVSVGERRRLNGVRTLPRAFLEALVGEGHHVRAGQRVDDAVDAGGGEVVRRARQYW
jgi:enoyl-CoA hydratase/carnithine racemase